MELDPKMFKSDLLLTLLSWLVAVLVAAAVVLAVLWLGM